MQGPCAQSLSIKKAIIISFKKIYIIYDIAHRRTLQGGEFLHKELTEFIKKIRHIKQNYFENGSFYGVQDSPKFTIFLVLASQVFCYRSKLLCYVK